MSNIQDSILIMTHAPPTSDNLSMIDNVSDCPSTNGSTPFLDMSASDKFEHILYTIVVPILFGLITIMGISGNSLVIYVIFSKQKMRTVTNLLLLNLAFADLSFVVICPPFTAYVFALSRFDFGNIACKLMHYLLNVTVYVTIYTLVLISIIRFMTVVYNTQTVAYRTRRNMLVMCGAIWVVMLLVNIPIIQSHGIVFQECQGIYTCDNYGPAFGKRIYATFFVFAYLLPLIAIAILSVCILHHINKQKSSMITRKTSNRPDKKKQASRLLILVVVIFAVFWLPVQLHLLVAYYGNLPQNPFYNTFSVLFGNCLAYFNSCVNPIIYNYASKDFRDAFREVVCCRNVRRPGFGETRITRTDIVAEAPTNHHQNGEMKRLVSSVKDPAGHEPECTDL